ncbi:hypothetical protein [Gemmobacter sp.]|uniref:hypothetical protein n=1 Tax=Gemmobacter sp. TaxID=1898957 RepID=UPI002B001B66|nr:hypothetical protein [Gemmobacter sp.]
MTGAGLIANYGKFLACLVLALVPGIFAGGLLLDSLLRWPWHLPPVSAGLIGISLCAILSTALFGLALRSGPGTQLRTALLTIALVLVAATLPFLPEVLTMRFRSLGQIHLPLIAAVVFMALFYPICILSGARAVSWCRVICTGAIAWTVTLSGMVYVVRTDRSTADTVVQLMLVSLATAGFLPFARMRRST